MPLINIRTIVNAPIERVFDLSRSIDAHMASTSGTREVAIEGKTTGLIGLGEEVTWQAKHFGVTQQLKIRLTEFERPLFFTDEMVDGAFASMKHTHLFKEISGLTEMTDEFRFQAPLWALGRIAERVFLTRYMRSFLIERNRILKDFAETDRWREFLDEQCVSPSS